MKITALTILSTLALSCAAAPSLATRQDPPATPVTPSPNLLSIITFFLHPRCPRGEVGGEPVGYMVSTGTQQWPYMLEHGGCQPVNKAWEVQSIQVRYLGEGCSGEYLTLAILSLIGH